MTYDLFSMKDRVVIVTGSSRGIGRSIVEEMARAGGKVVISSRKIEACNELRDTLRAEGADATAVACNAGRKDELQRLVDATLETYGRIDCVVSNAGINPVYGPLKDLPDEAWDKVMSTNVRSAWQLANMTLPEISRTGGGSFIIVSSISALRAAAGQGAYAVSKAAVSHLAVNLASEWGPAKIRVNAIAPGLIKTDFARRLWEDEAIGSRIQANTPLRRLGEPVDIGAVAVFLASDASRYITGQTIVVDGGVVSAGI